MLIQPPPDSVRSVSTPTVDTSHQQQPTVIHADSHATSLPSVNIQHPADSHLQGTVPALDTHHFAPSATVVAASPASAAKPVQPMAVASIDTVSTDTVQQYIPDILIAPAHFSYEYHVGSIEEQCNLYLNVPCRKDTVVVSEEHCDIIPTPTVWRQSMFTEHSLQVHSSSFVQRDVQRPSSWIFLLLVMLCFCVAVFYRNHRITFKQILSALFSVSELERITRECNFSSHAKRMPAIILYAVTSSILAYSCILFFSPSFAPENSFVFFYTILVFFIATIFLRNVFTRMLSKAFLCVSEASSYLLSNDYFQLASATVMLPILFAVVYIPGLNTTAMLFLLALPALLFFIRIVRGLQMLLASPKSNHFYLFYYLCTLEIIPLVVLYKMYVSL